MLIVAIVALTVVVLAGIGAFVVTSGDDDDDEQVTATSAVDEEEDEDEDEDVVLLEGTALEVPDPFTDSVALDEEAIDPDDASAGTGPEASTGAGGGIVAGAAPGLYGGTRDERSCDPEALVSFLEDDDAKAEAWAEVHDIGVDDIEEYVGGLTPVVLRRDTRVVNHGYRNGRATPRPAVLQAGTAVMVDELGVPAVKCSCGNPLGPARPVTTRTTYQGSRWSGFAPESVVVVRGDVELTTLVLVELTSGEPFSRPVGTTGAEDADAEGTTPEVPEVTAPETTEEDPAPVPPADTTDDEYAEAAIAAVEGRFCPGVAEYVTTIRTYETDFLLYRVEVEITLDSGAWTALFDADFATEFGPEIRPVNEESAALLC